MHVLRTIFWWFFFKNFQSYKFFWNLLLATSITSTVMANILQIFCKRQLNTLKNVFNTILERKMHTSSNTTVFLHNRTHLQVYFCRTCETTANTWSISLFSKEKNRFELRNYLTWTHFRSSDTNFYLITSCGFNLDESCCWFEALLVSYLWMKMKYMKKFTKIYSLERCQSTPSLFVSFFICIFFSQKKFLSFSYNFFLEKPYAKVNSLPFANLLLTKASPFKITSLW